MFKILLRFAAKKLRVPAGNFKTSLRVYVPERKLLGAEEFTQVSQEYLFKVKKALEEIKAEHPDGKLEIGPSNIRFEIPGFVVNIERDFSEQFFQVMVGDGITHNYFYDRESLRWVSSTDGHLMEELLCREITRKCLGYFNID